MTKIKVEEVISQGEYLKRLIDEQGIDNPFVEQITFLTDESILKIADFETKDNVTYTNDGKYLVVQKEIEIDEDTELYNIIVKSVDESYAAPLEKVYHYVNISVSELLKRVDRNINIEEIYCLDRNFKTHLIWEDGEMV